MKFDKLVPHLMLVAVAFIFATNFIVGKILAPFPPLFVGASRFLVAGVVLGAFLIHSKASPPQGRVLALVILMGITGVLIFNPLVYLGLHYTTSINATLIVSFNPMTIALLSHIWLKERMRLEQFLGMIISVVGVCFIVTQGSLTNLLHLKLNPGDLLIVVSTLVWASYTVLIRKASRDLTPTQSAAFATLAGLAFLLPAGLIENIWWPLPPLTYGVGLALIYIGLFPSVIAFLFWNTGVAKVGPTQAGLYYNLIPVFNFLLASQFLHEKLYQFHLLGSFFIIVGLVVSSVPRRRAVFSRPAMDKSDL